MRSGPELIRATQPFQAERWLVSWIQLLSTLGALALALFATVHVHFWPITIASGVIVGLIQVRLFIFYHDTMHGAIFRRARIGRALVSLLGYYLVTPAKVWQESHNFHHQNNAKMMGSSIGLYPLMPREAVTGLARSKLFAYRAARHPLTISLGYFTVFTMGMVIAPFLRNPRRYWHGLLALTFHYTLLVAFIYYFGWMVGICAVLLPSVVAMATGAYLFYAQHNFPTMKLCYREDWSFTTAALQSSSMFDMSRLLHWFTGNIGYHHVHHVNHLIPFYRLPGGHARAIPELQQPERTSWRLRDIWGCLRLHAWDHAQGRMITRRDLAA